MGIRKLVRDETRLVEIGASELISKPSCVRFFFGVVVAASRRLSLPENFDPLLQKSELFLAMDVESVAVPDGARD
jgi:hypothetical protein